jgi:hypothetical protein
MRHDSAFAAIAVALFALGAAPVSAQFNLDHYKCYKVEDLKNPKFEKSSVSLTDQFAIDDGVFEAKRPFMFCNPVDKNGEAILNADDHLSCYKVKRPRPTPDQRPNVQVVNRLDTLQQQAKKASLLCAPATKTDI